MTFEDIYGCNEYEFNKDLQDKIEEFKNEYILSVLKDRLSYLLYTDKRKLNDETVLTIISKIDKLNSRKEK